MEVKIKLTPFIKCSCGHESHEHFFGSGHCYMCGCKKLVPPTPQIIKEIEWILKNIQDAKTPEQKLKWKTKLENWGKAHPKEYESLMVDLAKKLVEQMGGKIDG
jgi:hypothetical protein